MTPVGSGPQPHTPVDFHAQNLAEARARALAEARRLQAQFTGIYHPSEPERAAGDRPATPDDWTALARRAFRPKRPPERHSFPRPSAPEKRPKRLEVRLDPELGRLAIGLDKVPELRVWAIARHHYGQPGWTDRHSLFTALQEADVGHSKRHYNRLLKQGGGLFWNLSPDGRVWLRSYVKVTQHLTRLATQTHPHLVATNIPGVRDVYLRVDGDLQRFKARIYAGWMAHREAPKIARSTLEALFGVSADTLRSWEDRLGRGTLEVIPNYAQTAIDPKDDDTIVDYIPEHAYSYLTRQHEVRIRWRQPNTYRPTYIRQHPKKGQSRKARTAAAKIAWSQPVERCATTTPATGGAKVAFDRSHRVPRRYFGQADGLRKFIKKMDRRGEMAVTPATPRYVFLGHDRNNHGLWELALDGLVRTSAWERISIKKEYVWRGGQKRCLQLYLSCSHTNQEAR
jgi:hypothetical protein